MKATDQYPSRQIALAKGASTYESEINPQGNPNAIHNGRKPLYVGVNGFAGRNFDKDFKNGTGFYGGSVFVAAGMPIGKKTVVRPSISVGRQISGISENNSWNATASFDLRHVAAKNVTLALTGRVTRVWFDDFFEDVTFVKRNDWSYGGNASATYRAAPWLTVSAAVGYAKRDSKFFLSSYKGFDTQATISATARF